MPAGPVLLGQSFLFPNLPELAMPKPTSQNNVKFVDTFSTQIPYVRLKEPIPSLMKPADDGVAARTEGSNEETLRLGTKANHPGRPRAENQDADNCQERLWLGD
jgi:hypothetical protein